MRESLSPRKIWKARFSRLASDVTPGSQPRVKLLQKTSADCLTPLRTALQYSSPTSEAARFVRDGGNHQVLHNSGVVPRREARGLLGRRENGEVARKVAWVL